MTSHVRHNLFFIVATLLLRTVSAFHSIIVQRGCSRSHVYSPPSAHLATFLKAENKELPISEPQFFHPTMVDAAQQPLPWELVTSVPDQDNWQNGENWLETRQALMDMWVLPRDISNGSWDNYAEAANRGEEKVLRQVPQLLRLEPKAILESARTVLNKLNLPPALLRSEPLLLAMAPERLCGGFQNLPGADTASVQEACREDHGLLVEAATTWTEADTPSGDLIEDSQSDFSVDTINWVQTSFDNEVSADDVHMEEFLKKEN